MKTPPILEKATQFPADPFRTVLLGLGIALLWGSGLVVGGWSANLGLAAAHAGRAIPWAPWLLAFLLVVSGMLSVVYGVFFRARAVEINEEEVALIRWDGKGKSIRRDEIKSVEAGRSRIILHGADSRMEIGRIFTGWENLKKTLMERNGRESVRA